MTAPPLVSGRPGGVKYAYKQLNNLIHLINLTCPGIHTSVCIITISIPFMENNTPTKKQWQKPDFYLLDTVNSKTSPRVHEHTLGPVVITSGVHLRYNKAHNQHIFEGQTGNYLS